LDLTQQKHTPSANWSPQRQTIYDWMRENNLLSFAALYVGVVTVIHQRTPGFVRFVGHAVRDMMNGMAAIKLNLHSRRQADYVKLVDGILLPWTKHGVPRSFARVSSETPNGETAVSSETFSVPIAVVSAIHDLLDKHESARARSNQSVYLFFEAFIDAAQEPTAAHVTAWKDLHAWFQQKCHDNGTLPDQELEQETEKKFCELESIFLTVADRHKNTITRLDEILDQANR
jgi:hypothetical protein